MFSMVEMQEAGKSWTPLESAYFSVVTATTIGYGDDFVPKTENGRLATIGFALASLNVMGAICDLTKDFLLRFAPKVAKAKGS